MKRSTADSYVAAPHVVVLLLLAANIAEYLLCLRASGVPVLPTPLLIANGALVPDALRPDGLWRLVAAGFLHADPTHLLANMVSLLIIGPFLERRLGASTFALLYLVALAGAGLTSLLLHREAFVGVGASGALFGIMGALFALWALGAEDLSPGFFLVNFAINFGVAARDSRIDWAAHIGGFITGMACVALLDILSRANRHWLRCKFPEFAQANATLLIGAGVAWLWFRPPAWLPGGDPRLLLAAVALPAALGFVKLLDLLLAVRRGLVGVVLVFAASNAAAAAMGAELLRPALAFQCRSALEFGPPAGGVAAILCPNLAGAEALLAGGAVLLTLLACAAPLRRGLRDVGFVGATFVGNRQRERGLVRPARHTRG